VCTKTCSLPGLRPAEAARSIGSRTCPDQRWVTLPNRAAARASGFERVKPRARVVRLAGFVVGTADQEIVRVARTTFEPDIVIGIERVQ